MLGNTGGGGLTIIETLEREISSRTTGQRFGIVLLTPDDMAHKHGDDVNNIYLPFNDHVKETAPKLCQRLRDAGFELDPDAIATATT